MALSIVKWCVAGGISQSDSIKFCSIENFSRNFLEGFRIDNYGLVTDAAKLSVIFSARKSKS